MRRERRPITILIAEDDPDDRLMIQEAFDEARLVNPLHFVEDGEQLLDYLRSAGRYAGNQKTPPPGLIMLDLNMPRKDGREALQEIKLDPELKRIPVVILTTSQAEEDVVRTYDLGVNSFIKKPVSFESLVTIVTSLHHYWFEIVTAPDSNRGGWHD